MSTAEQVAPVVGLSIEEMEQTLQALTQNYHQAEAEERNQSAMKLKYLGAIEVHRQLLDRLKAKSEEASKKEEGEPAKKKPALKAVKPLKK